LLGDTCAPDAGTEQQDDGHDFNPRDRSPAKRGEEEQRSGRPYSAWREGRESDVGNRRECDRAA